jgi:hypothetical protein
LLSTARNYSRSATTLFCHAESRTPFVMRRAQLQRHPVLLYHDQYLPQIAIDLIARNLGYIGQVTRFDLTETNMPHQNFNTLAIVVIHGKKYCDPDTGKMYYFSEEITNWLEDLRKVVGYIWIAGCACANIDVSYANTDYSLILQGREPATLQPFLIDNQPILSVRWLVSFLQYLQFYHNNLAWWTSKHHPLRKLDFSSNQEIIDIFSRLSPDLDIDLFPNTFSFPEMFHCGVYVAISLDSKLQVYHGKEAIDSYTQFKEGKGNADRSRFEYLNKELAMAANRWYSSIINEMDPPVTPLFENLD